MNSAENILNVYFCFNYDDESVFLINYTDTSALVCYTVKLY